MAARVAEVGAEKVRPENRTDPLGFGLSYPVMFMAYDADRGTETPLSGLMYEDDANLVVVSLVAEAIAEEVVERTSFDGHVRVVAEYVYVMEVWN